MFEFIDDEGQAVAGAHAQAWGDERESGTLEAH